MQYNEERIKDIINESENDIKLKSFFSKIKNIFGEDYASLILCSNYDIKKSINVFSSKFYNIDIIHVQFLLLQAALLSDDNQYKELIDKKMAEDDFYCLFPLVVNNLYFRKGLIRLFVDQCDKKNQYIINSKNEEEKEKILNNITELKRYARFLKVQDHINNNQQYNKVKKRKF